MKKLIILIIVAGAVSAAGFSFYRYFKTETVNVLKFSGELEMTKVDVSFRVSGQIEERFFSEGQPVKKGDLVAELDSVEYEYQLKLAKADELSSKWALSELNAGNTAEEIAQAKKQLDSARTEEQNAKKDYDRAKRLYDANSMAASDFDKTSTSYKVTQLKVAELSERLKQLQIGPRYEKIEQAKAQLEAAEANTKLAEQKVAFTKTYSPISGVVMDEYKEAGEFVQAGSPVVSVGDPNRLWLRAYLPENKAHMLKLGQKMAVTVDSLPNVIFDGVVTFISDQAEFTPKQIQTTTERVKLVYRIKIEIADTMGLLKPGIPADAVIKE